LGAKFGHLPLAKAVASGAIAVSVLGGVARSTRSVDRRELCLANAPLGDAVLAVEKLDETEEEADMVDAITGAFARDLLVLATPPVAWQHCLPTSRHVPIGKQQSISAWLQRLPPQRHLDPT
jgi:hypothetical protein